MSSNAGAERATLGGVVGLLRPGNAVLAAVGSAVGALAGGARAEDFLPFAGGFLVLLVALLGTAGGNALNDLFDRRLDRAAHPTRPLPSGRATVFSARLVVAVAWALALAAAAAIDAVVLLVATGCILLVAWYETALKSAGLFGHLAVAVAAGTLFPLGALAVQADLRAPLVLGGIAAMAHLGRELLKAAEDSTHDAPFRRTFAVVHGPGAASKAGALALVVAVGVSPLPHFAAGWGDLFLVAILPADALFVLAAWQAPRFPARARAVAKAAMVLALAAFVVGALT